MRSGTINLALAIFCGGGAEWAIRSFPPPSLAAQWAVFFAAAALLWGPTEPYRNVDLRRWDWIGNVILLAWAFVWLLFARIVFRVVGWP